jgi:hypothetical protein
MEENVSQNEQQAPEPAPQPSPPQQSVPAPTSPEEARERLWSEGTDEAGNWKDLRYKHAAEGKLRTEGPNPAMYKPHEEARYEQDYADYRTKKAVQEALSEPQKPAPDFLPRDEKEVQRNLLKKLGYKDSRAERHPTPTLRENFQTAANYVEKLVDSLEFGEAAADNNPKWDNPFEAHNQALRLLEYNADNHENIALLPREESAWGPLTQIRPRNMEFYPLSKGQYENYQLTIRDAMAAGETDPVKLLEAGARWLRKTGVLDSTQGQPTIKRMEQKAKEEESQPKSFEERLQKMSQKEFEALRNKAGAKRY